jgi:hypothetical protein
VEEIELKGTFAMILKEEKDFLGTILSLSSMDLLLLNLKLTLVLPGDRLKEVY